MKTKKVVDDFRKKKASTHKSYKEIAGDVVETHRQREERVISLAKTISELKKDIEEMQKELEESKYPSVSNAMRELWDNEQDDVWDEYY